MSKGLLVDQIFLSFSLRDNLSFSYCFRHHSGQWLLLLHALSVIGIPLNWILGLVNGIGSYIGLANSFIALVGAKWLRFNNSSGYLLLIRPNGLILIVLVELRLVCVFCGQGFGLVCGGFFATILGVLNLHISFFSYLCLALVFCIFSLIVVFLY